MKLLPFFLCIFVLSIQSLSAQSSSEEIEMVTPGISTLYSPQQLMKMNYNYRLFQNSAGDWGFEIIGDGKTIVIQNYRQVTIKSGKFSSKLEAERTAKLRLQKLKNGDHKPLTTSELATEKIISPSKSN